MLLPVDSLTATGGPQQTKLGNYQSLTGEIELYQWRQYAICQSRDS